MIEKVPASVSAYLTLSYTKILKPGSQENPRPTKSTENTRRLTSETPTNPAPIAATMTKFFEKIVACGLRAKGQMKEFETSSEKENISSTMNYYDDPSSTAPYKLHV